MDSSTFFIYYCIGNNKKNIANKTDNIPDAAPTKALKNVDEPKVSSKPSTTKKPVDVEAKTPMKQAHVDTDVPATKNIPEGKASELKKVDADIEKPKNKQVADGEKPPKSEVLDDNPNLKDKELDNFKKYEDDVDASTKKKAKEDGDAEAGKGKDRDSKAKAIAMAKIIIEANDRVDTPIPGLLTELAPLKAMKGVKNFKAESRGNGKFEIYLIASKIKLDDYDIDPESEKGNKNDNLKDESSKKKYTEDFYHGKKPEYINPGHHDKTNSAFRGGGASKTELLPENHEKLWKRAIPGANELETKQGIPSTWYSIDEKGKIHQFQVDHNRFSHWAGSENGPSGIKLHNTTRKRLQEYYKDFLK